MADNPTVGSPDWLQQQISEYDRIAPQLQLFAGELERSLKSATGALAPLAIVQVRMKKPASFAQKALKKQHEHPCPIHQFTDLCGGRVIARTRKEVDAISAVIEESFQIDWANSVDTSQRLSPTEFGYRSIHYIVSFRPEDGDGQLPDGVLDFECSMCGTSHPIKGEVQIRTTVEHAFSDFSHDISYKGAFELPPKHQRAIALLAAELENVDEAFGRIENDLSIYAADYGAHLSPEQLEERITQLGMVLEIDPVNASLAWEIGKLAIASGDWERARDVLDGFTESNPETIFQPLIRDLGKVLCQIHEEDRTDPGFARGQRHLEMAGDLDSSDPYALTALADTLRGIDDERASELYRSAFDLDPTDAYPLTRYLEYEVGQRSNMRMLDVIGPLADRAVARCDAQASVRVNLPQAYYGKGELQLLMGDPYGAIDSYARAIMMTTSPTMLEDALEGLEVLKGAAERIEGLRWILSLLALALPARFPDAEADSTQDHGALAGILHEPIVIVAGATDDDLESAVQTYRPLLDAAFVDFEGTVISGGTVAGISGLVGDLGAQSHDRIAAVGYVPDELDDSEIDPRYDEIRRAGSGFSPEQSLRSWRDIVASGADPAAVKVLGVNGGAIAAAEYRVAAALGAQVGLVRGSGRAVDSMIGDSEWADAQELLPLPNDPQTVRAFVAGRGTGLSGELRERLATEIHRVYCDERARAQTAVDEAQAPWPDLVDTLKESNRLQADHIAAKLRSIGCEIVPTDHADKGFEFSAEEVELLAEMEHGRWNADRLADGWVWGETKDIEAKVSPYIVPWEALPENIKEYDREAVKAIPTLLAGEYLAIRYRD